MRLEIAKYIPSTVACRTDATDNALIKRHSDLAVTKLFSLSPWSPDLTTILSDRTHLKLRRLPDAANPVPVVSRPVEAAAGKIPTAQRRLSS
jgi:hypothetical protein